MFSKPEGPYMSSNNGIATHSTDERYVIFSLDADTPSGVFTEYCRDNNIGFKIINGKYKGEEEISYIVNVRNFDKVSDFIPGQESYLYLSPMATGYVQYGELNRVATLVFKDGTEKELGVLRAVNKSDVKDNDYSYDPITNTYFMVFDKEGKVVNA